MVEGSGGLKKLYPSVVGFQPVSAVCKCWPDGDKSDSMRGNFLSEAQANNLQLSCVYPGTAPKNKNLALSSKIPDSVLFQLFLLAGIFSADPCAMHRNYLLSKNYPRLLGTEEHFSQSLPEGS